MKEAVKIKSYPKGLKLQLDPEADMNTIISEINEKFYTSREFFGSKQIALAIEGREISDGDETQIIDAIRTHSDLFVVCTVGRDEELRMLMEEGVSSGESARVKAAPNIAQEITSSAVIMERNLTDMDDLEIPDTLIVYGDIAKGAKVHAGRNVIVMGGIYGEVHAGENGSHDSFIFGLELDAEILEISKIALEKKKSMKGLFRGNAKKQPSVALLEAQEVVVYPATREILHEKI